MSKILSFFIFTFASNLGNASCGITDDIPRGNLLAKSTFSRFIKSENLVTASSSQMPSSYVTAETYGATGNDLIDDTVQLQNALIQSKKIWLSRNGIYRISKKLKMPADSAILSDGTATILMLAGPNGFNNATAARTNTAIYGDKGTGIEISGNNATIRDISLVKEYEDNRYVIGVYVLNGNNVTIDKISMRGFSIAPGIITISSSPYTTVSNTIIHNSCTKSTSVPSDLNSFQITGIVIDDGRVNNLTSDHLRITNNVIVDLFMNGSWRNDQTDGINYAGSGVGNNILISNNYIDGVAEGLDLFGSHIRVSNNSIGARELSIKLIHQANNIAIDNNHLGGKPKFAAVKIYNAQPGQSIRPNTITIRNNFIDTRNVSSPGVEVEAFNGYSSPYNISISDNIFAVNECANQAVICDARQCEMPNNDKFHEGVFGCP